MLFCINKERRVEIPLLLQGCLSHSPSRAMSKRPNVAQPNVRDDLEALLDKKGYDTETDEESTEPYKGRNQRQLTKLYLLKQIRNLAILCFVTLVLFAVAMIAGVIFFITNSDPIVESIQNARMISSRVNAMLEPGAPISSIMSNMNTVTSKLPYMQQIVEALIRDEILSMVSDLKAGLKLVAKADNLMNSFSSLDPNEFLVFAENNQLAQRSVRILVAVNDFLNRLEDPTTQQSLDAMTTEASTLLTSMKAIITSMHQNGLGLTVKM